MPGTNWAGTNWADIDSRCQHVGIKHEGLPFLIQFRSMSLRTIRGIEEVAKLSGHTGKVSAVSYSSDGVFFLTRPFIWRDMPLIQADKTTMDAAASLLRIAHRSGFVSPKT